MDALDELMDRGTQPVAEPDTVDDAMDAYIGGQVGAVRAGATVALDANPDEIARQKRIAQSLGVPLAAVEADPVFATREQRMRSIEQATASSPALRQKFSEADFAKLAGDNVENLSAIEQSFLTARKLGRAGIEGLRSASAGAVGIARLPFDVGAAAVDPLVGTILPENPLARGAQWLKEYQQGIAGRAKANMPKGDGNIESGVYSGVASLTRNLAALPMAFLPGGQRAALGAMVAPVGGEAYGEAREEGKGIASSLVFGTSQAAIEYATEKLPLSKLIGDLKEGTPFFKTLLQNAALEVPGEQLATALQDLNEWAVLNPEKPFSSYIEERPDAAVQTLVATLVGTGGQVTVMEGISKAVGYAEKRATKADQAEQSAAFVENINQLAAADKLLQRDADTFEQFVAAAAEDGPVDTVFVDGRMLMQSGMAPRLADLSPSVRDQLDRAILTGGDIAIPVSEYAARIAPTDLAPQLIDHIKTEADGFTRAEAQDFMANQGSELQAEVERILAEREDADVFRQSQDVVKQDILGQLNTAGRFTPQVNEAYATLASSYSAVRAAQLGMTPEEFHQQRGMKVQGEAVGGQGFSQGGRVSKTVETFGENNDIDRQIYVSEDAPGDGLRVLAYPDGRRVVQTVDIAPEKRGKGIGQQLYIAALRDGDIEIRPQFRSEDAARVYDALVRKGIAQVVERDGKQYLTLSSATNSLNQSAQEERDLVVTHNLSAENLLHAVKMGGIPVPSLAITKKETPLTGFGEITLVGSKEMADPKGYAGTKVFGADIYSPRYPRITYVFDRKAKDKGDAMFAAGSDAVKRGIDWSEVGSQGPQELANSAAVMWTFLKERGIEPTVVRNEVKPLPAALMPFATDNRHTHELVADPVFAEAVYQTWEDELVAINGEDYRESAKAEVAEMRQNAEDRGTSHLVRSYASAVNKYRMDSVNSGTVDTWKTRTTLQDQVREAALSAELDAYAADVMAQLAPEEKIFQGFTNSGNRKYVAHTIENVVKILKKELRAGENFSYGVGSIRAKYTPQFKSIEQIRKAKNRLMDREAFEKVKAEIDADFDSVAESLRSHHRSGNEFGFGEVMTQMMYDAATMGVPRALKENVFADVPVETQQDIAEFLGKLRTLPTEYFEAKILRDVDLAEFSAAVVPEGVKPEVIKALQDRGIKDIRTYKKGDEGDRAAKIGELEHLFFQPDGGSVTPRGAFNPATNTVALLNNADLTTFLHESAHYFFENDIGIASELLRQETLTPGEQAIVDDVSRLLKWHGIQGDINDQLRQWYTMDFEEQRAYHERTAESFEAYLFSGKAPSLELQPVFQRFASWMVKVYESLKAFLARNPEAGKLNDEVRQVFDRMIATREEIALAQQARSMIPLFNDPAKSGVSVETIADIQAQHAEATATAVDELQAKGMRDLQWLANAKGRQIARLKREAKGLRSEVEIEARREVMSQPVYRAWEFLTGKPSEKTEAQTENELEVADWKQRRVEAMDAARDQAKKDAWENSEESKQDYETGRAKGMAKGQFLARNKKDIDLVVARAALDWDRANPKPEYAKDSNVFDTGEQVFGKFNRAALEDMGIPAEIVGHIRKLRMTADDGMHPDLVATMFDFSSGDELVRTLAAAQSPKEAITELADRLMLERHGELATPEAIELAADAAIHNDARARMVSTEYNALAKATGDRKLLTAAAKEYAAQIVARLKVRDIRPSQYANAETRAAKAAMKASAKGDMQTAAAEKRNQVINLYATRAAYDAKDEVKATMRAWSKLVARSDKTKSVDIDLLNAVRAILGEYGIAPKRAERAADYLKSVQAYDPEMYAVIQASVESAEANAKPVNELTLTEFRALRDEIDSIMHLAKRSRQMEIDGDMLDIADVQDELMARMTDYGIPDKIPGEGQAVTPGEERMNKLKSLLAFARRVESWVGQMDGKQQMGPFRRYVWSRISDAAVAYRTDKAVYLKQFRALVESIAPTLKPMLIHAPELGYTFGKDSGGSAINEILHAVLHTGNESNKRKMLLGRGWAVEVAPGQLDTTKWDSFIARMVAEGKITQAHYDFAQGVWDMLDSMKPAAQKTHRDVFGKYFDEVTANPFTDPFGVKRAGGYIPAMTDSRVVKDAELRKLADEDNAAMSYAFPTTPKGFTQARTEYNKPLMLDLRTLGQHIDKVLLFSHMEMPVREVQRVLSNKVGETLNRIDQTAISGMLLPWLNRSAKQQVETPIAGSAGTMRFFSVMRSHAGMAAMFGNLANTVQQLTGFSLAAVKVKPGLLLSATADYIKSPREFARSVAESSAYMNTRMANEVSAMTDAIDDILLNPSKLKKGQAWTQRHAYFLQSAMDNSMSPIIWTAAYNQAVQNGANHEDAVRLADGTVRQTQGAMQAEDIARIEGGNAFVRMFTQFAGYFNMNANLLGTEYVRLMHDGGLRKNAGRGVFLFLMGYMVPAVVGELIIQAFRGGPGDDDDDGEYLDDWIAAVFGWAPLRYATAMVPVGGQAVNAAVNAMNSKPYDDRLATSPAISMLESAVRAPVSVYKSVAGEGSSQKAVRDVATLMSMTLGLPANFVARPVGYGVGVMDDDIDPTGGFDFTRGVLTGTASPDSKTQ